MAAPMYGDLIRETIRQVQVESNQRRASHHTLGMSSLGGCREYVRASLEAGDGSMSEDADLKWAAMVGTLLGDGIEHIMMDRLDAVTQNRLTLHLKVGETEITVEGTADLLFPHPPYGYPEAVVDLKTAAELYTVRREGPKFGYRAQIAGYLIAAIEAGVLSPDAVGELVFFDRSGKDSTTHSWQIGEGDARVVLEAVSERLQDVVHAIDTGQRAPRDEDPGWCAAVGCPFFAGCWGDGSQLDEVTGAEAQDAMRRYKEARDKVKEWTASRDTARDDLLGVSGIFPDGTRLSWSESSRGTLTISVTNP